MDAFPERGATRSGGGNREVKADLIPTASNVPKRRFQGESLEGGESR